MSANGTFSMFVGTFKAGGDFRKIGVDPTIPGNGTGFLEFEKDANRENPSQLPVAEP